MNERQQSAINWIGRILTWVIPVAAIVYQAGVYGQQINSLDRRVTTLEQVASASQTNAYRLSRLDAAVDGISKKSADDHDTLVRIDQTVQGIMDTLNELKSDIKQLSGG